MLSSSIQCAIISICIYITFIFVFFFQAEDGIRDGRVTGVQTCALPIFYAESLMNLRPWKLWTLDGAPAEDTEEIMAVLESVLARQPDHVGANHYYIHTRSEERRVGKECRYRRAPYQ